MRVSRRVAWTAVVLMAGFGAPASAQRGAAGRIIAQSGTADRIYACVGRDGSMRIAPGPGACRDNEVPIDWSTSGTPGRPGLRAPQDLKGLRDRRDCRDPRGRRGPRVRPGRRDRRVNPAQAAAAG
jgi:hypothetical protein